MTTTHAEHISQAKAARAAAAEAEADGAPVYARRCLRIAQAHDDAAAERAKANAAAERALAESARVGDPRPLDRLRFEAAAIVAEAERYGGHVPEGRLNQLRGALAAAEAEGDALADVVDVARRIETTGAGGACSPRLSSALTRLGQARRRG